MAYTFSAASQQYLEYSGGVPIGNINNRFVTISCWAKASALSTGSRQVAVSLSGDYFGSYYPMEIGFDASSARAFAEWNGYTAVSTVDLSTDTWYNLVGVFEYAPSTTRTDPQIFVNGGQNAQVTGTGSGISGTLRTRIGNGIRSSTYLSGSVAEVGMWQYTTVSTRFTNTGDIARLAAGVSPLVIRPGDLVSCMPLVRGAQDLVWGQTLTEVSSPTVSVHPRVLYPTNTALDSSLASPLGLLQTQVGGLHTLVDANLDAEAQVGGLHTLVDANLDADAQVGALMVLVDAKLVDLMARVGAAELVVDASGNLGRIGGSQVVVDASGNLVRIGGAALVVDVLPKQLQGTRSFAYIM